MNARPVAKIDGYGNPKPIEFRLRNPLQRHGPMPQLTRVASSAQNATARRRVSAVTNSSKPTRNKTRLASAASCSTVMDARPVPRAIAASPKVYGV